MQVAEPNNVKIYNLSAGKSLPDWLSAKKRRALQKKDIDIRRRIELIQDFTMPGVSTTVKVSSDGQYILATGIYKPRVRCFEVNNLSMKFERCFDSEVVTFEILSEDYSKIAFLHCDRVVEFHAAHGRYHRLRVPRFGRDMKYHYPSCDLFIAGAGSEIYRLNLERGQFLNSLQTEASEINKCAINSVHGLLVCGTKEGKIEAWDTRMRNRVGILDCALNCATDSPLDNFPSVTALQFEGPMMMGVGTATGHVLLYDIRSNKPFYIKDHMYGLPILDIDYLPSQDLILSMDSSILKIWNKNSGQLFTSIEAPSPFNNLCLVPNTGLMFMANENTKILTYYIPSMGPAPKWCGILDTLTEELEESKTVTVYDDYKFVTKKELEELNLDYLIGTKLLRAYMHGYFMDIRLYKKAKSLIEPFAFEEYKKKKIKAKIDEERENRVKLQKLPSVNKELALKLMEQESNPKHKKRTGVSLLKDERFKALFENPDFEVDKNAEEYRLLNPVLSRLDKKNEKILKKHLEQKEEEQGESEEEVEDTASSDDDHQMTKELKRQHRLLREEAWEERQREEERLVQEEEERESQEEPQPQFYELQEGETVKGGTVQKLKKKIMKMPLGERVTKDSEFSVQKSNTKGSREMSFSIRKPKNLSKYERSAKSHHEERRKIVRSTKAIKGRFRKPF